jgi:hypothetical protein
VTGAGDMNIEPKPFASLSSSLLARKGQAKPAMRPQGFAGFGFAQTNVAHDDLGWNDMGHDPAPVSADPVSADPVSADIVPIHADMQPQPETEAPVVVHQQREDIARELAPAPVVVPVAALVAAPIAAPVARIAQPARAKLVRAAPGSKGKAAFTLRLDPERHLKLRLVCAVEHRSAQQVVAAALDAYLGEHAASLLATNVSKKSR